MPHCVAGYFLKTEQIVLAYQQLWVSREGSTVTALVRIAANVRTARLEFANKGRNDICSTRSTPLSLRWKKSGVELGKAVCQAEGADSVSCVDGEA